MSVIVKGLKMPESCGECSDSGDLRWLCTAKRVNYDDYANFPPHDCPLEELPTPHGRLIDENDVIKMLEQVALLQRGERQRGTLSIINELKKVPTIIEAEND